MEFEWDPDKDAENQRKHDISFAQATELWNNRHVEIEEIAYSEEGEKRSATLGWVGTKTYVAIWTKRSEKVRLISVRRANKNEEKIFFKKIQNDR